MKEKLGCAAAIVYVAIAFVQVLATIKGIQIWFDLPWILAAFISAIVGYIPVVGTIARIKGATAGWGSSLWPAIAFFCGPYIIYFEAVTVGSSVDLVSRKKKGTN